MKLVKETDPILKKVLQPFDFENPIMSPQELVAEMQRIRKESGGVGLAASQIGIDARVIVIGMGGFETEGVEDFERAYFNPVVKSLMPDEIKMIEGCLSFPDLYIEIKRKQI
jgi:peptide deformylase